ncbi:MAG: DHHA1 domain-containing protein [Candidatus Dojkabacteria bacterium]|nr:DHHA1 domain-containing protein [Candidatus Dojkabacteria bacterium]
MLKNKTKYHRALPITFLFYDYGTKFKFDPSRFSIKEVINELYGLEGTLFVFCLDEDVDEEKVNISITTITDFDVSEIAKMFNGGGHKGAAGGYFLGSIKEAHKKIMLAIKIKEKEIKEAVRKFFEI